MIFGRHPVAAEIRGGIFQDFAPSFFHVRDVMLPLVRRMGVQAEIEMQRPGYVPTGGGILCLRAKPVTALQSIAREQQGRLERFSGIAIASHLDERKVARRMADSARAVLRGAGQDAEIDLIEEQSAMQRGAAPAMFANFAGDWRLGADWVGAPHRPAEAIGERVAHQLLADVSSGATLDSFAADQIILFFSPRPFRAMPGSCASFCMLAWMSKNGCFRSRERGSLMPNVRCAAPYRRALDRSGPFCKRFLHKRERRVGKL